LVHLVNLRPEPLSGCRVELGLPVQAKDIQVLYPPTDLPLRWKVEQQGRVTCIEFDRFDVYAVMEWGTGRRDGGN